MKITNEQRNIILIIIAIVFGSLAMAIFEAILGENTIATLLGAISFGGLVSLIYIDAKL